MRLRVVDEEGPILTGRATASALRARVEKCAELGEVVVDLGEIEVVSPSFADEFFGKLPDALLSGGRVRFEHVSDELARVARVVTAGRAHLDAVG
jgi:anti-anti-sigma regulatory factor